MTFPRRSVPGDEPLDMTSVLRDDAVVEHLRRRRPADEASGAGEAGEATYGGPAGGRALTEEPVDDLTDHLAADRVVSLLGAWVSEVDQLCGPAQPVGDTTSAGERVPHQRWDASSGSDGPSDVRDRRGRGRRGSRVVSAALAAGAALATVSGVAAAVTGDPLAPYRPVIQAVAPATPDRSDTATLSTAARPTASRKPASVAAPSQASHSTVYASAAGVENIQKWLAAGNLPAAEAALKEAMAQVKTGTVPPEIADTLAALQAQLTSRQATAVAAPSQDTATAPTPPVAAPTTAQEPTVTGTPPTTPAPSVPTPTQTPGPAQSPTPSTGPTGGGSSSQPTTGTSERGPAPPTTATTDPGTAGTGETAPSTTTTGTDTTGTSSTDPTGTTSQQPAGSSHPAGSTP